MFFAFSPATRIILKLLILPAKARLATSFLKEVHDETVAELDQRERRRTAQDRYGWR